MSHYSQFYTGADPSYFPARDSSGSGLRNLLRIAPGPATLSLIGSIVMIVVGMRLLWQSPAEDPAPAEVSSQRQTHPEIRLVGGIQGQAVEVRGIRHRPATNAGNRSVERQSAPRTAVLETPALLPLLPPKIT